MKKIVLSIVVMLAVSALFAPVATAQGLQLPTISVSPVSYDFGQVPIFAVASTTFVVTNSGDATLFVTGVKTKLPFGDSETSFRVRAHSSYTFTVLFAPSAPISYSGICTIVSNAHNAPALNIPLSGEGIQ